MNDLVSVIITTYKGEQNIRRAVESVIAQTYQNIEILVVDDNGLGTDHQKDTERVLQEYIASKQIHYIPHEINRNGSAARNTGARLARGKYICLLDDDDAFYPDKVSIQVKRFKELPSEYAMLYSSFRVFESNNFEKDVIARYEGNIALNLLLGKVRIASSLLMIKRDAYWDVGGFDESFKRHQDWEFIVRFCQRYKVSFVPDIAVNKFMLERNTPKSGALTEQYRLFYLKKMEPYFCHYDEKTKSRIYEKFYLEIAKAFFLCREIDKFMLYSKKVHNPLLVFDMIFRETVKPIVKAFIGRFG